MNSGNLPTIYVAHEEYTHDNPTKYLRTAIKTQMDAGDYCWFGAGMAGGLERKKIQEVVQLLKGGKRHISQLIRCRNEYTVVYLAIEGEWREGRDGILEIPRWVPSDRRMEWVAALPNTMWGSMVEHLTTLEEQLGVRVKTTKNYQETCRVVEHLASWWQQPVEKHKSALVVPGSERPFSLVEPGVVDKVAAQLPGIGYTLSGRVADRARTPHELDGWTLKDWTAVEGIGKGKAQAAMKAWHGTME